MTVTSTTRKKSFNGDGATVLFSVAFRVFATSDLEVYVDNVLQTEVTDYTVALQGNPPGVNGADVTFGVAPPSGTSNVDIVRVLPSTQQVALPLAGKFPSTAVEEALDRAVTLLQDRNEDIDRAVKVAVTSSVSGLTLPEGALKGIRWNAAGTALELITLTDPAIGNVITTRGDMVRGDSLNTPERFALGLTKKYLKSDGIDPVWDYVVAVKESAGTVLDLGAIIDGEFVKRSGTSLVSSPIPPPTSVKEGGGTTLTIGTIAAGKFVKRTGTSLVSADITDVKEGGGTVLNLGAIIDTEFVKRAGTSLVSGPIIIPPAPLQPPQGRLTLVTGIPVSVTDQAGKTTIYYTPYLGDQIPIYNGTSWDIKTFTELSIAMAANAAWAANKNYDLYVFDDAGTLRLGTGAAWTNDTTRAEGLVRQNGLWVNSGPITVRYAVASTFSLAAKKGTYVGTMRTTGTTGTTTLELGGEAAGGDPGLINIWNAYNRVPFIVGVYDNTNSWTYTVATWRQMNASNGNRVSMLRGIDEDAVHATRLQIENNGTLNHVQIAFGLDSTSVPQNPIAEAASQTGAFIVIAVHWGGFPGLGYHYLQALEKSDIAGTSTWTGDNGVTDEQSGFEVRGVY